MSVIGNIIWILLGGIWMSLGWVIAGVIMYLTVIGIPWGRSCFVIAGFALFPFGHEAVSRKEVTGRDDLGTGSAGMAGNIVWLLLAGWWLALGHLATGLIVCLTVIGIPFGIQHFKLAGISLMPVGKTIVPKQIAAQVRQK
jgi:uncharacterized membrane protein YccF (DUF307 family)